MIAWFLSKKTSVGQGWISKQLGMGVASSVSHAIKKVEQTTLEALVYVAILSVLRTFALNSI